jgi:hypothetical protein
MTTKVQADMYDLDGATGATVAAADKINFLDVTDSLVKEDTVQGILDLGGGAWNLIGTQAASTSASLTQTGLSSTYAYYVIHISDLVTSGNSKLISCRFGDSSGIDSGASDYEWWVGGGRSYGSGHQDDLDTSDSEIHLGTEGQGNVSGEASHFTINLNLGGSSSWPSMTWIGYTYDSYIVPVHGAGVRKAIITTDRFQIFPPDGTLDEGRMTTWGVSHA